MKLKLKKTKTTINSRTKIS